MNNNKKKKIVITYGTFDLIHYGHLNLLKRASELGDYLIVGVSTDEFCLEKGKKTQYSLEKRMEMVSDLRYVNKVIPEYNMHQKIEDIKEYDVDVFCLGSDYAQTFLEMEEYPEVRKLCEVTFIDRTPNISSTILRSQIDKETSK